MKSRDFVDQLRADVNGFEPPVRSLMDVDFYKLTMGQLVHNQFPDVEVTFKLIVRDHRIPIATVVPEEKLRKALDHARDLRFSLTDLYYLRGINLYQDNMFGEDYLNFLRNFRLPPYELKKENGSYELAFKGKWKEVSHWETIALAIISELYYRELLKDTPKHELEVIFARATDRIYSKLEKLKTHPSIFFADFGQRRRFSFLWQEYVIGLAKKVMGSQFTGTSNTWMAFHHDLPPIGTNAHELPMVITALAESDEEKRYAQYKTLALWEKMYGQGLRIFLPDTYGSAQFFANAPSWLTTWRGQRQDSGDPKTEGDRYSKWLYEREISAREKITIFSDGLDVDSMIDIDNHFDGRHPHPFGWGTLFTNDFAGCDRNNPNLRSFSMVCKAVEANGRPCVKLSNNIKKATGPKDEIARYLRIFGNEGRGEQEIVV